MHERPFKTHLISSLELCKQGKYPEATMEAQKAIEHDPKDYRGYLALAAGCRELKNLDAVRANLYKALEVATLGDQNLIQILIEAQPE